MAAYTPNATWNNGAAPGISAEALNHLETQYSAALTMALPLTGGTMTGDLIISNTAPKLVLYETDATSGNRRWRFQANTEGFYASIANDDESVTAIWLRVERTGTAVDTVNIPNGTLQAGGNTVWHAGNDGAGSGLDADKLDTYEAAAFLLLAGGTMSGAIAMGNNKITGLGTPTVSGDATTKAYADLMLPLAGGTMTGDLIISNTAPKLTWIETDGAVDNKRWKFQANSEGFYGYAEKDDVSVATIWLRVERTGTTIDTVNFPNGTLQAGGNTVWHNGNHGMAYGAWSDTSTVITASGTYTETIAIGFSATNGELLIEGYSNSGAIVYFGTALNDAISAATNTTGGTGYNNYQTDSLLSFSTFGAGGSNVTLLSVRINGTNLEVAFRNDTAGDLTLYVPKMKWVARL